MRPVYHKFLRCFCTHYLSIIPSCLEFSFPGSRFPGTRDSRPFSFPDSREIKRRHSRRKAGMGHRQLFIKWDVKQWRQRVQKAIAVSYVRIINVNQCVLTIDITACALIYIATRIQTDCLIIYAFYIRVVQKNSLDKTRTPQPVFCCVCV